MVKIKSVKNKKPVKNKKWTEKYGSVSPMLQLMDDWDIKVPDEDL